MPKTTVIYHSADFDGIFCHEIAKKFLGTENVEYIGWDFKDAPLSVNIIDDSNTTYVMDLPVDRVFGSDYAKNKVDGQGYLLNKVVWIDHHKSSIETHPDTIPGYRIDGVSACRLAWQWFFIHEWNAQHSTNEMMQVPLPAKQDFIERLVSEPYAVRLAGEYDVWDHRDENAVSFQFGLRSRVLTNGDWQSLLTTHKPTFDEIEEAISTGFPMDLRPDGTSTPTLVTSLLADGRMLNDYQERTDAGVCKACAYVVEWQGLKFLAMNTTARNSQAFAAKDVPETGHDALLKFNFTGQMWDVSMYHAKHRTDLDLSAIAVKMGGGGHRGACGFRTKTLPFIN